MEILVAVIGSSLIGTSLTTIYSDIYLQPYIDIKVTERHNELSLDTVDYYEVLFKNTGQKYASNSQLNLFFFANITKYLTVIHPGNVTFEESTKSLPDSGQILPSILSASLDKFPKNSIILIYVWVKPWEYNTEQQHLSDAYYISATYDEGSNHLSSNALQTSYRDNVGKFIPDIKEESSDFVSLTNISFVTTALSVLAFAILFRIRRLKQKKGKKQKNASTMSSLSQKRYDILFLIPIIFASSVFIFFIEVYLKDAIFVFFPKGLIDLTNYHTPINMIINFEGDYDMSIFPFLIYGFFGFITIWITKLLITYTISKFILKYSLNTDYHISFKIDEGENKKLFLLCTIISLPIYTLIDYFFSINISPYTFLTLMMFIEFIQLSVLFYFLQGQITGDKIIRLSTKLSKIFCSFTGIIYLVICFLIVRQFGETFHFNIFGGNFADLSSIFEFNSGVAGWFIFSFLFFFSIGTILIIWSLFGREKTRSLIFYFAVASALTIFWLALRIYMPILLITQLNMPILLTTQLNYQLGYPGLFGLIPLILNLGLFAITFHILNAIIDYVLIKKNSIILGLQNSKLKKPRILVPILSIVIISVLTPLVLLTSLVESTIQQSASVNDIMRPSSVAYDSGVFYLTMRNSDCFRPIYPGIADCIRTHSNDSIVAMDVDPLFKKLFIITKPAIEVWDVGNPYNITYNYSKPLDFGTIGDFSLLKLRLRYYDNTIFILYDNKIAGFDLKTGNTTHIDLERLVDDFAINPKTKDIFVVTPNGYGVLNGNTGKEMSFTPLQGIPYLIEYNPDTDELYISYRDFKDNRIYIIVIKSDQIIEKFETNGYPLKIGGRNIAETGINSKLMGKCNPPLTVLMYQPNGIAAYSHGSCSYDPAWQNLNFNN